MSGKSAAPGGYDSKIEEILAGNVDICPVVGHADSRTRAEDSARTGWFVGRVARNRVTARDKREVPTASHVVRYTARQTNGKIDGLVEQRCCMRAISPHLRRQPVVGAPAEGHTVTQSALLR